MRTYLEIFLGDLLPKLHFSTGIAEFKKSAENKKECRPSSILPKYGFHGLCIFVTKAESRQFRRNCAQFRRNCGQFRRNLGQFRRHFSDFTGAKFQLSIPPKLVSNDEIPPKAVFQSEIWKFRRNPKSAKTSIHLEFPGIITSLAWTLRTLQTLLTFKPSEPFGADFRPPDLLMAERGPHPDSLVMVMGFKVSCISATFPVKKKQWISFQHENRWKSTHRKRRH